MNASKAQRWVSFSGFLFEDQIGLKKSGLWHVFGAMVSSLT
jgi:hypothetical protein